MLRSATFKAFLATAFIAVDFVNAITRHAGTALAFVDADVTVVALETRQAFALIVTDHVDANASVVARFVYALVNLRSTQVTCIGKQVTGFS